MIKNSNTFRLIISIAFVMIIQSSNAQFISFSQSFNLLTTIAGKGGVGEGTVNGWNTSFEGKAAIEAVLSGPHFAMADSVGNVYIADKDAHAIRKVGIDGLITTVAGINTPGNGGDGRADELELNSPNGLWVNKRGDLYILDLGNNKIRKVDAEGNMVTVFEDFVGISLGRGLWISAAEDTIWYASGTVIKMWTKANGIRTYASGFSGLGNIMQDQNGYIVATDRSANYVYRIDANGTKTVIAGNGSTSGGGDGFPANESAFNGVRGVWFLEDNTYLLATHEGSQIWYIDSQNIAHLFLNGKEGDEYHSGDGENYRTQGYKVSEVRAVTVDYQGNILITENDRGFIRKIAKSSLNSLKRQTKSNQNLLQVKVISASGFSHLSFNYPGMAKVSLKMFNPQGRKTEIPFSCNHVKGTYDVRWNNKYLSNGIYNVQLQIDECFYSSMVISINK